MIPVESTWYYVFENTYVRDDAGKVWRCLQQRPWPEPSGADFALIDPLGNERLVGMPFTATVTIMLPTLDEAVSVVQRIAGGAVIREEARA
jgi:hypothetical protein